MRIRRVAATVVAMAAGAAGLVACGSGDAADLAQDPEAGPTTVDLNPTTTAVLPIAGALGTEYEVDGVAVEVVDVAPFLQSQLNGAQIVVEVRSDNRSPDLQRNPNVTLRCSDREGEGDWAGGSTWEPMGLLPVNAMMAGEVVLAFPFTGANAEYRSVTCADPAVRLRFDRPGKDPVIYDVPIDPVVIEDALRAPTGPLQPIPYDAD